MGSLTLSPGSSVYLDTNCIIYSVEHVPPFDAILLAVWQGATAGNYILYTSALTLTESLVGPLHKGDLLVV
jgi:hypothetical protein